MEKKDFRQLKISAVFVLIAFAVYYVSALKTHQYLNYFMPLANSFLHLKLDVNPQPYLNELVPVDGKYFVVYPPAPALVLLPFVAIFGPGFNQRIASLIIAALSIGLFYLLLGRFTKKHWIQIFLTLILAFGSNFFFTSLIGSSWHFAHVCAVFFSILALLAASHKKPFLSGLALGAAFLSRLPVIMIFPVLIFLLLEKTDPKERGRILTNFFMPIISAIIIFGLYNFFRFGSISETGYSLIPGIMGEPWFQKGVFDVSYLARNIKACFASFPTVTTQFPYLLPSNYAMAIYLSSPALLLMFFTKTKETRVRFLFLSIILAALPGFMHATVGFTQFGYRFSLDYIVLLLLVLVWGFEKVGIKVCLLFTILSLIINFYVVYLYKIGLFVC